MEIEIPVFNWFEEPIKESVNAVFRGLNIKVESLDLFKQYRDAHLAHLNQHVSGVKILGMQQPIDLADLYYPATISTDIRRRIYAPEWNKVDVSSGKKAPANSKTASPGDVFVQENLRTVVLGGPGAGSLS